MRDDADQPRRHHGPALPRPLPHEAPGVHGHSGEPRPLRLRRGFALERPLFRPPVRSLRLPARDENVAGALGRAPPALPLGPALRVHHRSRLPLGGGHGGLPAGEPREPLGLRAPRAAPRGLRAQPPSHQLGLGHRRTQVRTVLSRHGIPSGYSCCNARQKAAATTRCCSRH